ncbi:MAG: hypothetical protein OXN83_01185 [Oligoflexia bacterium]|nr:hypothetical protein [Oligoflexia bacterium]
MNNCPRCGSQTERVSQTIICKCGWTYSKKKESSQATVIVGMILAFTLVAGSLFHFFQWGSHGFSILFASPSEKIKICMDLKKYDCVEHNYQSSFEKTGDVSFLEKLGEIQFKRGKFDLAKKTYSLYFSKQSNSVKKSKDIYKAAYYYAHSLAKTGDIELAIQYFDNILTNKPHVLMVTVMESYLEVLVSYNRIRKARELLAWINQENKGSVDTVDQIQVWRKKFNI